MLNDWSNTSTSWRRTAASAGAPSATSRPCAITGWWLYRRGGWRTEALPRALLWLFASMTFSGWVATVAGWYVTEIGRQPFIVYGLLRTADVASKTPAAMIATTLVGYLIMYALLIVAYVMASQALKTKQIVL